MINIQYMSILRELAAQAILNIWSILREPHQNRREVVTVSRRAARGGEVEVTELVPKWSPLLPTWSLSIMDAFLTSVTSRNSLEQRFHRCEQRFTPHPVSIMRALSGGSVAAPG